MKDQDLELLHAQLKEIQARGWIANQRPGNFGGVGNTLEDLLHVAENNLQLPDFGTWELKSQRSDTTSLLTLFHIEPLPRKAGIVPKILLPHYGWAHQQAGSLYPATERSFRQTINVLNYSARGFRVSIDQENQWITVDFCFDRIEDCHEMWREEVKRSAGTGGLEPRPYWTFAMIEKKLKKKLNQLMYVSAQRKKENGVEFFKYDHFEVYVEPSLENFLQLLKQGYIYVDFDARTGHNHGTKFRIRSNQKKNLYQHRLLI